MAIVDEEEHLLDTSSEGGFTSAFSHRVLKLLFVGKSVVVFHSGFWGKVGMVLLEDCE